MASLDGHQPAFPGKLIKRPHEHDEDCFFPGMTMREHFAGLALQGILSHPHTTNASSWDDIAEASVQAADALVRSLHK